MPGRRVALAVLVGLACAGCHSSSRPSGGVVPWLNRPLSLYVIPEAKLVRYPTTASLCRPAQLRVTHGRIAVGLGNRLEELVFRNVSPKTCLLRGYPTITARGRRLHLQRGGTYFGRLTAADLRPGKHVFLDIATSRGCDGGSKPGLRYTQLVFALPQGGSVRGGNVSITDYCGLSMSEFGLPRRYSEFRAIPGTAGTLQASLRLPLAVRAGSVLRYTVTLSNPTTTAVVFHSCPGYTEGMYASGVVVRRSFVLNCSSVHAIAPRRKRRFAMQLTVPGRVPPTTAKLAWNLDTATGPFAGRIVRVLSG